MSGIETISITPDPEHLMGKWQKNSLLLSLETQNDVQSEA